MEISTGVLIHENVLVDPFMTYSKIKALLQPARYLLRAPVLTDQGFDQDPGGGFDATPDLLPSVQSKLASLLGSIASQLTIPWQFPVDGGFMNHETVRNLRLVVFCFQK